MTRRKQLLFPSLLLWAAACAATPAPAPEDGGMSVVAIAVSSNEPMGAGRGHPTTIWFAKLEEDVDPAQAGPVLKSNYRHGNVVCLVNAEPGRYVAVGGFSRDQGEDRTVYFPAELIRATEVTVGERGFAYMGTYLLDVRIAVEPDPAQAHYLPLISPDWVNKSTVWKLFQNYQHFFGRGFRRQPNEEREIELIREPLVEAGWAEAFK